MSRLEHDLRSAFRRQEPSAGFSEGVMRRIAQQSVEAKVSWWRSLLDLFQPRTRWLVVTAAASIVLAVLAYEYLVSKKTIQPIASINQAQVGPSTGTQPRIADPKIEPGTTPSQSSRRNLPRRRVVISQRTVVDPALVAKGEKAKEQLFLALQIASETLNDTQRLVQTSTNESHVEPKELR